MAADPRGRFIWYECMTPDMEGTRDFYNEVVGWGEMVWEETEEPYHMFTRGEVPIAGFMKLPDDAEAPPHWLGYVHVPDIHEYGERAEELGATAVFGPHTVPDIGTMTVFADPQGAAIALYQPENAPEHLPTEHEPGHVSWHEHMTEDWEKAWDFYSELLGWQKTDAMDMGPEMGLYQIYGTGEVELGGMMTLPDEVAESGTPPHWMFYFMVADLDAAVQKVNERGGQVINGPMEVPGGDRIAVCLDHVGAAFGLHQKAT